MALIAMIRNEADVLSAFLGHVGALFDRVMLIDHMSTDGSRALLDAARNRSSLFEVYRFSTQGYFQAALSNAFARKAFAEGADWAFFLDADEWLDVADRDDLISRLPQLESACSFAWRNLAPTQLGSFERFDVQQEFLASAERSPFVKVALSRRVLSHAPGFWVETGNHVLRDGAHGKPLAAPCVGDLFHVPIRSVSRFGQKLSNGAAAYRAKTRRRTLEGFHWFELLERFRDGTIDDDGLRAIALAYGSPADGLRTAAVLSGATRGRVAPPGIDAGDSAVAAQRRSLRETAQADRSVAWTEFGSSGDEDVMALIDDNADVRLRPLVRRADGIEGPETFSALRGSRPAPTPDEIAERLLAALDIAFAPIRTLTPSAWTQHVPTMFGLIALLRPRRFVELGSHFGCSFFAANQAIAEIDLATETVAIDTWEGDPQAGHYGSEVFDQFKHTIGEHYRDQAYYIRARFTDALPCFADGSIDLLHIDGLHTYDAVRCDFETWLPKMSDQGVILMHDTAVYRRNFGVWRFWNEVANRYPNLNLLHGHGLGLAYVGSDQSFFPGWLEGLAASSAQHALLSTFLRGLGDLSVSAAESTQAAARLPHVEAAAANAAAAMNATAVASATAERDAALAEVAVARTEAALAKNAVDSMRNSTSWRITAPLRAARQLLGRA